MQDSIQDLNLDCLTALLSTEAEAPEDVFSKSSADGLRAVKQEPQHEPNTPLVHFTDRYAFHSFCRAEIIHEVLHGVGSS